MIIRTWRRERHRRSEGGRGCTNLEGVKLTIEAVVLCGS